LRSDAESTETVKVRIIVGIGCENEQRLAARVLECSIRRQTAVDINFIDLCDISTEVDAKGNTPFSFQRFTFAQWYLGADFDYGVYLDSDMCAFGDILDLIQSFITLEVSIATCDVAPGHERRPQSAVMVFDEIGATRLTERFERYRRAVISYSELMYFEDERGFAALPSNWNCLEYFDSKTCLIHWTDMDGQPWLRADNHLGGLWVFALVAWLNQSKCNWDILYSEISKGHVRPSLSEAVSAPYSSHLSFFSIVRDLFFLPPHRFQRIPWRIRYLLRPFLKTFINFKFLICGRRVNEYHG